MGLDELRLRAIEGHESLQGFIVLVLREDQARTTNAQAARREQEAVS